MPDRADRHREHQVLWFATGPVAAPEVTERVEITLRMKKSMWMTKRWRKGPDAPPAEVVVRKLRRRALLGIVPEAEARIRRRLG